MASAAAARELHSHSVEERDDRAGQFVPRHIEWRSQQCGPATEDQPSDCVARSRALNHAYAVPTLTVEGIDPSARFEQDGTAVAEHLGMASRLDPIDLFGLSAIGVHTAERRVVAEREYDTAIATPARAGRKVRRGDDVNGRAS